MRVIDVLGIALVDLARPDRAVLAHDVVDDALMWREWIDALLLNLGPGILGGVQEDVVGDALNSYTQTYRENIKTH